MKRDKLYHLIAGFVIAFGLSFWRPDAGLIAAVGAGIAKEFYDKYVKKSVIDPLDTLATIVGGIAGIVIALILINTF